MTTDVREIGERIRRLRSERRMSVRQLAAEAGLSHTHLGQMENGRIVEPSILKLVNIAKALRVSLAELLGEGPEPSTRVWQPPEESHTFLRIQSDLRTIQQIDPDELDTTAAIVQILRKSLQRRTRTEREKDPQ